MNVLDEIVEGFGLSPELVSLMPGQKSAVLLGLDIGTSGVRASLFDERGEELPGASVSTQRSFREAGDLSVIDADKTLELVTDTIDLLLAQPFLAADQVELISISCFWHSLVGVDDEGRATTPVFGWADMRAVDAARELRSRFDEAETHSRSGCRFHPSYWPAKLLWLRQNQPEAYSRTSRWLSFSEYVTHKLFGESSISVSMASGTGLMDQRTCEWDLPLMQALNLPVAKLPEITSNIITRSRLSGDYARRWPQLRGALLCLPIADGAANNIGSGCTTRDRIALMIGTSGAARVLFEGEPPERIPAELWCYRADSKRVVVGGALSDGGGLYRWLQELMLREETPEMIDQALQRLEPDAHGLTVLPFWAGERSTGWSLSARGCLAGLTLDTQPIEILRAAMEAVAYRFALILRALEVVSSGTVVAAGNALQSSSVWPQIIADVIGRPVLLGIAREASTRGAALLALEAAGKIASINDLEIEVETKFTPDTSRHTRYKKAIERQQRLYRALIDEV